MQTVPILVNFHFFIFHFTVYEIRPQCIIPLRCHLLEAVVLGLHYNHLIQLFFFVPTVSRKQNGILSLEF